MSANIGCLLRYLVIALYLIPQAALAAGGDSGKEHERAEISDADEFPFHTDIRYARGFSVEYHNTYKVLTVHSPWPNADVPLTYLLVQRNTPTPAGYSDAQHIEIPVRKVVTLSTSYLPYLDKLGLVDRIIGHDDFRYVCTPSVRNMIEKGSITEVGEGSLVNVELIMELNPDLVMTFHTGNERDAYPLLIRTGLPVVINAEWYEENPLAMAEWIKFIALFFNREKEAEVIFDDIVKRYESLRYSASQVEKRPTVLLGAPFQGTWWVAGGRSFAAQLLEDAGADYLWENNENTGAVPLGFEAVFAHAQDADFWLNTGNWHFRDDALGHDWRLTEFRAYREGRMYNNNRRLNGLGGNDFWESGKANPHLVLADLIAIFHPELMPDHSLFYYRKLE
jgi:iron complex transport system substrate-binding protein